MTAAEQLRVLQKQHHKQARHEERLSPAVRSVISSTGTGFVYGTLFGSVVAGFEGLRASPAHQRLRGMLYHMKANVPQTAGRIAMVTCLFRVSSVALTSLRGGDDSREDMWNVLFAAPVAGVILKIRHGPRAAMRSALAFGSIGAVMVVFHSAETKVAASYDHHHHRSHTVEAREVLEEIAFAEELE